MARFSDNVGYKNIMSAYNEKMENLQEVQKINSELYAKEALKVIQEMSTKGQKIFSEYYKNVNLMSKQAALQDEINRRASITASIKDLRQYAENNSEIQQQITEALNSATLSQEQATSRLIAMQKSLNSEKLKGLGPIARWNEQLKRQQYIEQEITRINEQRRAALAAAADDAERAQINEEADSNIRTIRESGGSSGTGSGNGGDITDFAMQANPIVGTILKVVNALGKLSNQVNDGITNVIDTNASVYAEYMGKIDARIQGSDNSFNKIYKNIAKSLDSSPYVKQSDLIKQVGQLADQGIAYNLEERAYLQELRDRMVTTFDALDASLTRLIRLQQSDMTASQLGAEAALTQFLNSRFKDTSYLNSLYDSVSAAILDASSQLNVDQATSYNYAVQKWLGALYSRGMSESAIGMLAQGLNYLTTGNVSALNSNNELTTLFGLAASRSGMSYSSMLTQGLNAEGVNNLMKSIVELLQDISHNTSNQVTKAAWGDIVNMTLSDFRSATNLTTSDINAIYNQGMNYSLALSEASNQLSYINSRTYVKDKIDNMISNVLFSWTSDFVANQEGYKNWKLTQTGMQIVQDLASEIPLIGDMISNTLGVVKLAQTLIKVGLPDLSNLSVAYNGAPSLFDFGWDQYNSRGDMFMGLTGYGGATSATGTSYSSVVSNSSSGDSQIITLQRYSDQTTAEAVSRDSKATLIRGASDIYAQLFDLQTSPIRVKLTHFEDTALEQLYETFDVEENRKDVHATKERVVNGSIDVTASASLAERLSNIKASL